MKTKRVVITGLGTVNPCGLNAPDTWKAILAGESGIGPITGFDTTGYSVDFGGEVKGFCADDVLSAKESRKLDPFIQYALVAADEALNDAGLGETYDPVRCGVAVGSGIGGISTIETNVDTLNNSGPRRVSPFLVPGSVVNMAAGNIAIRHGFKGPNFSIATACTTGTHNIGFAARTIAFGDADLMVAGGAEMACSPLGISGFAAARALSTRTDSPQGASRPWDVYRDGFVLSSGAAVLVLESLEHAQARGAKIYAELSGFGMSDDAYHVTSPPENGEGAALSMANALHNADLTPDNIGYINAHGTSTLAGDLAEINAIKSAFGKAANSVAISSTKSMTGHLIGAAGSLEALISVLALCNQKAPGTLNLTTPSPGCDLDLIGPVSRGMPLEHVMSNSFGFGGTNATLIFSRISQ